MMAEIFGSPFSMSASTSCLNRASCSATAALSAIMALAQFAFVSVLVITVLAQPLLVYVGGMKKEEARQQLHEIVEQMESIEYQEKGENIFEQYLGKVDQKEE